MLNDFSTFKEEVKSRIDIVDVVGEFIELKKRGSNYVGSCPFHNETKPSFSVNRERQFYHCFGCGKGGDIIGFLMDITGMSFMEALVQLAERVGLKIPEKHSLDPALREETDLVIAANMAAAEYFHRTLYEKEGEKSMEYLLSRGFTKETIRTFRLGFSPEDSSGLIAFARKKSVSYSALESAGILKKSSYGGAPYNRFGGRVIFPIIDQTARIIGFGARILEGEGAKYINSPESPVYHKSRVLFGIYQAKSEIKLKRTAIVVEGYADVISLYQSGIKNVIAASGTALTTEQGRMIARMARNVTLLFDGDKAGLSAASRGADNLLATDLTISIAVLPEGYDPDSYIREKGADSLREFIGNSVDIWEFKLEVLGENISGSRDKIKIAGEIADSISLIADELKREIYIQEMSKRTGIDNDAMRKAVNGRIKRRKYQKEPDINKNQNIGTSGERELLASIVQFPNLAHFLMEEAGSKLFSEPITKTIADEIFNRITEGLDISPSKLMSGLADRKARELIASVAMITIDEKTAEKCIKDNIKSFKINKLRAQRAEISQIIMQETDMKKKSELIEKSKDLLTQLKMFDGNEKQDMIP